jgi:hypothetical protein
MTDVRVINICVKRTAAYLLMIKIVSSNTAHGLSLKLKRRTFLSMCGNPAPKIVAIKKIFANLTGYPTCRA